jgi:hypothetical protein
MSAGTQRDILTALDDLLHVSGGYGLDSTGVGNVLLGLLLGDDPDRWAERLSGFTFNRVVPAVNPKTGEMVSDPVTGRQQSIELKEQATQLLEAAFQARYWELPADPDVLGDLQNHTATPLSSGRRRFAKVRDHFVDALRCLALRPYTEDFGVANYSAPITFAVPEDNQLGSAGLREF